MELYRTVAVTRVVLYDCKMCDYHILLVVNFIIGIISAHTIPELKVMRRQFDRNGSPNIQNSVVNHVSSVRPQRINHPIPDPGHVTILVTS